MRTKTQTSLIGALVSKAVLIFLIQIFSSLFVSGQVGKSFWFAAPDILQYQLPNFLRVTTLSQEATITISQPANPSFAPIIQKVSANSNFSFDVTAYANDFENIGADIITQKGILIESTARIMAYYEPTQQFNPDLYSLKGDNALGTDFIITSQKLWFSYSGVPSSFYVVATEDATTINITPSVDLVGHPKSAGSFNILLQKGEVYIADATGTNGIDVVGGSIVTSDKPVAVTMTNDLVAPEGGCGDQNGDQLIPSSIAGTDFITLPGNLNVSGITDLVYVYPTIDGTQITVNGVDMGTKNRGEYLEIQNKGQTQSIIADKPSLVYQVSGTGCEVGGAAVPTVNCTGSTTVGITRASSEGFTVLLLVKAGGEGNFKFDGSTGIINAAAFQNVPNTTDGWKYATISLDEYQLPTGTGAIIKNTTPFHLGVINGVSGGTRYGYFSSFGGFQPDIFLTPTTFGDLYTDFIGNSYQWYKDGIKITDSATSANYTATVSGSYSVEVTYGTGCPPARSEAIDLCFPRLIPAVSIVSNDSDNVICAGTGLLFTATATNGGKTPTFQWQIDGADIPNANDSTYSSTTLADGKLVSVVMGSSEGCVTSSSVNSNNIAITVKKNIAYYRDVDGDGYGITTDSVVDCNLPSGYVTSSGDCDDNNQNVNPSKTEVCGNGIDDNCDGQIDEGCSVALPCKSKTLSQGGWAATSTTNPLTESWFISKFQGPLVIGGAINKITITSAASVRAFLPNSGTPVPLSKAWTNPTNKQLKNTFAGQLVALALNLKLNSGLGSAKITSGLYANKTVQWLFDEANRKISTTVTKSSELTSLSDACNKVNLSFDGTRTGFVDCSNVPPSAKKSGVSVSENISFVETSRINAVPNPTHNHFTIRNTSNSAVRIRILNVSGTPLETFNKLQPFETRQFGSRYIAGTYLLEITEREKITVKTIYKLY